MVKVRNDLTNRIFGRLRVIEQADDYIAPNGTHYAQWLCECSCEEQNRVIVRSANLISGSIVSCGCYNAERLKQRKYNKNDLSGEYGILWLNGTGEECYFDLEDAKIILQYTWCNSNGYAITVIDGSNVPMHQLLGYHAPDHYNHNKLDNRKENLIVCTPQENARNRPIYSNNTSGFIGVGWVKKYNQWRARIYIDDREKHLGCFNNKEDAIKVRLQAEVKYFGEFAPQRHLFEQYGIVAEKI